MDCTTNVAVVVVVVVGGVIVGSGVVAVLTQAVLLLVAIIRRVPRLLRNVVQVYCWSWLLHVFLLRRLLVLQLVLLEKRPRERRLSYRLMRSRLNVLLSDELLLGKTLMETAGVATVGKAILIGRRLWESKGRLG